MKRIAAALNGHDAAALKAMFSPSALEQATDFDARLGSLVSLFPNGGVTWASDTVDSDGSAGYGAELLKAYYKLSADGHDYWFYFADFTVDEKHAENVGVYAMGVTQWAQDTNSGPAEPFFWWADSIHEDGNGENGYAGVYTPADNNQLSSLRMSQLLEKLNSHDHLGLKDKFTESARAGDLAAIQDGIVKLFALFPGGDVAAQGQQDPPVVREKSGNGQEQLLLLSRYRVSAGGVDYWLFCADFRQNTVDPSNLGIYAIGVARRTASEDSAAEKALFSWADTFTADASTPPGILISR